MNDGFVCVFVGWGGFEAGQFVCVVVGWPASTGSASRVMYELGATSYLLRPSVSKHKEGGGKRGQTTRRGPEWQPRNLCPNNSKGKYSRQFIKLSGGEPGRLWDNDSLKFGILPPPPSLPLPLDEKVKRKRLRGRGKSRRRRQRGGIILILTPKPH